MKVKISFLGKPISCLNFRGQKKKKKVPFIPQVKSVFGKKVTFHDELGTSPLNVSNFNEWSSPWIPTFQASEEPWCLGMCSGGGR